MSEAEEDPAFARVWVKDEPDECPEQASEDSLAADGASEQVPVDFLAADGAVEQVPVDFLAADSGKEDDDDDDMGSGGEIDPMSVVKSETMFGEDAGEDDGDGEPAESLFNIVDSKDVLKKVKKEKVDSDAEESEDNSRDSQWVPLTQPVKTKKGNKYQCPYCSYKAKMHVLKNHIRKHTDTKDFKCPFCDFMTNYDAALRRHLKSMHGDSDEEKPKKTYIKKYRCQLCPYITAHRHGLRSHMQGKHTDQKNYKCAFCTYETKYSTALHRHRFTQHKEEVLKLGEASREYKCDQCDFTVLMKSELRQHQKKHLLKNKCHLCRFKCETEEELQLHLNDSHLNKDGKVVKNEKPKKPSVKKEKGINQVVGSSTDPIFKCRICEHEAVTYVAFLDHVKSHEKVDPYKCNVCGYETTCNATFLKHLQMNHGVTDDGINDIKVISEGIMSAMQAISMGVAADSDDEPLASHQFDDDDDAPPKAKKKRTHNKTFSCTLCDYTTKYKVALKSHMGRHTDEKPHKCHLCDYSTKYPTSMRRHKMLKHAGDDPDCKGKPTEYLCSECSYKTYYKNNLNLHMRKHNSDKQYKCECCSFGTVYRTAFLRHAKIHKRKLPNGQAIQYQCEMCPYSTQYEGRFSWHMLKTHNKRGTLEKGVKCDFCDFETNASLKFRLTAHLQRSKQPTPMKCLHCDFETFYKCEVKYHRKSHYPEIYTKIKIIDPVQPVAKTEDSVTESLPAEAPENLTTNHIYTSGPNSFFARYKDEIPNYEVESSIAWKKIPVLENRALSKPFSCYKCTYASRFKSSVQRHFQRFHGNKAKPYRCSHCDFGTSTKDSIALHTRRSKQDTVMTCDCGQFSTIYKCELVIHQKLHNPYRCSKCTYSSKSKYDLERHYTMHSNKGYKCRFCSYVGTRRDTLLTHEVTHTGVRPYQCHLCPYGSIRLRFLEKHIIQKHEGDNTRTKPFQCHACPYGSFSQVILDKHIAQNHSESNVEMTESCNVEINDGSGGVSVDDNVEPETSNTNYYDDSTTNEAVAIVEIEMVPQNHSGVSAVNEKQTEKGVKPFQCPVCPYSAFSPKVLKKHMTIHSEIPIPNIGETVEKTGIKPFQCHMCPYSSFRPNILKNHLILKHSVTPQELNLTFVEEYNNTPTEKTYQCHICSYSSMSLNVLNKHLALKHDSKAATATENTVKTFQCHHCPFNSLSPNVLKKHVVQTHSGLDVSVLNEGAVKPCRCHLCPYSTFSPKVLNKHLLQRHPGASRGTFESYTDNSVEMISVVSEND